jgi:MFS transporter, SP family, sugar:H+ symporter
MEEFATQQAMVRLTDEKGGFKELWQGTNLKRSLIVIGANVLYPLTGQGKSENLNKLFISSIDTNLIMIAFGSKYGTVFLKEIGGTNPYLLQLINSVIFIVVVLCSMSLVDVIGRRFVKPALPSESRQLSNI